MVDEISMDNGSNPPPNHGDVAQINIQTMKVYSWQKEFVLGITA